MNIAVISGSARPDNQSIRVAAWMQRQLEASGHSVETIDLSQVYVPEDASKMFDESNEEYQKFLPTKQMLDSADAAVVVSPEWHGMPPGKLISFFQCINRSLAHVPCLMVSVSDTRFTGTYPSVILRAFSGKNTRIVWVPEYIVVRDVKNMIKDEPTEDDAYIQARLKNALQILACYGEALKPAREDLRNLTSGYANGM